jgi:protoporphyrin/coproporphyrin ferrochelatase
MTAMDAEPNTNHPAVSYGKVGVLLVNLGTPDGTDVASMRRYLREFLSDRRVIEWSRLFWYPILYGIVLNTRPRKVGKAYELIWNKDLNESWLRTYTRNQAALMAETFGGQPQVVVDWAMRYGQPSIASRIEALQKAGCERILVFPLYPQYAAATTATVNDKAFEALLKMRWQPALRTVPPYHDDPVYIDAVVSAMRRDLARLDFEPEVILVSFHGVPKSYLLKGDPYHCHCVKTWRLMREAFGWPEERFRISFQSRFGNEEWLRPYTDETVTALGRSGVKRLAVVAPGFSADCLETLEELDGENRHYFEEAGGEKFAYLPCLNDGEEGMRVICHIVQRELQGWI